MERSSLRPYPVALTQLAGVRCVVVGGGEVAVRKVRALMESGAYVRVISPELHTDLYTWRASGRIECVDRPYEPGDLVGCFLVIAATNQREVNAAVAEEARSLGILHNIADDPDHSSFHTLAAVTRGDVLVAASTGGASPALAAHIRRKLEQTFGPEYGLLAERLGRLRREVGHTLPPPVRTQLWRALTSDSILELVRTQGVVALDRHIETIMAEIGQA